ncbi:MAG: Hsp20 family protein [Candidatus Pacebacteria bacterium]|nr:Hsp20 family protein [Candidatus Paceibacterota bacterium]
MNNLMNFRDWPSLGNFNTKDMGLWTVGFDKVVEQLESAHNQLGKYIPGYPPYNIKKTGDDTYVIELAIAGFSKSEVEVNVEGDTLRITGKSESVDETDEEKGLGFLYKGISNREFTRAYTLADHVEVKHAEMVNGLLKVFLENVIPESKKPTKVDIKGKD